jgi:hypothetical protein
MDSVRAVEITRRTFALAGDVFVFAVFFVAHVEMSREGRCVGEGLRDSRLEAQSGAGSEGARGDESDRKSEGHDARQFESRARAMRWMNEGYGGDPSSVGSQYTASPFRIGVLWYKMCAHETISVR